MSRWDAMTMAGGVLLPAAAWWIFPPAAAVVLAMELIILGMIMDANKGRRG